MATNINRMLILYHMVNKIFTNHAPTRLYIITSETLADIVNENVGTRVSKRTALRFMMQYIEKNDLVSNDGFFILDDKLKHLCPYDNDQNVRMRFSKLEDLLENGLRIPIQSNVTKNPLKESRWKNFPFSIDRTFRM